MNILELLFLEAYLSSPVYVTFTSYFPALNPGTTTVATPFTIVYAFSVPFTLTTNLVGSTSAGKTMTIVSFSPKLMSPTVTLML